MALDENYKKRKEKMEWEEVGEKTWMMIEQAKEELQMMETQYPNRFGYLKLEIRSFISVLESQSLLLSNHNDNKSVSAAAAAAAAASQASSSSKKRKKLSHNAGTERAQAQECLPQTAARQKIQMQRDDYHCDGFVKPKSKEDRVDAALEKAQACLFKIQQFKTSFL